MLTEGIVVHDIWPEEKDLDGSPRINSESGSNDSNDEIDHSVNKFDSGVSDVNSDNENAVLIEGETATEKMISIERPLVVSFATDLLAEFEVSDNLKILHR